LVSTAVPSHLSRSALQISYRHLGHLRISLHTEGSGRFAGKLGRCWEAGHVGISPCLILCFCPAPTCLLKPLQSPDAQGLVVQSLRRREVGGSFWLMRWAAEISWQIVCLPGNTVWQLLLKLNVPTLCIQSFSALYTSFQATTVLTLSLQPVLPFGVLHIAVHAVSVSASPTQYSGFRWDPVVTAPHHSGGDLSDGQRTVCFLVLLLTVACVSGSWQRCPEPL